MNGMVTSPHYRASQSGLRILREGGNAVEAAIAVAATVAVAYPQANSVGGDNFWLIARKGQTTPLALNASGRSGSMATLEHYREHGFASIPARGYLAANMVPGAVSGWEAAYRHSVGKLAGKIPWKLLLEDAIGYARDGLPVSSHQDIRGLVDFNINDKIFGNLQRFPEMKRHFCKADGSPLRAGDVMRQVDLAGTLEQIGREGARAFYKGDIAKTITAELLSNDGVLTREDFANHTADWVDPISVPYRDYTAFNMPPNTQGMAALGVLDV